MNLLFILIATLCTVMIANPLWPGRPPQKDPTYTLITKTRTPTGLIVAEPIYPTILVMEPLNALAKGLDKIAKEEV